MEGTAGRGHSLLMALITILWERADDVTLHPPPPRTRSPQGSQADIKNGGSAEGGHGQIRGTLLRNEEWWELEDHLRCHPRLGVQRESWKTLVHRCKSGVYYTHTVHTLEFEFWSQARFVRILVPMNKLSDRITWGKSDWFWLLVSDHEGKMRRSRTDQIIMV